MLQSTVFPQPSTLIPDKNNKTYLVNVNTLGQAPAACFAWGLDERLEGSVFEVQLNEEIMEMNDHDFLFWVVFWAL